MSNVRVVEIVMSDLVEAVEGKGNRLLGVLGSTKNVNDADGVKDVLSDYIAVELVLKIVTHCIPEDIAACAEKIARNMMGNADAIIAKYKAGMEQEEA